VINQNSIFMYKYIVIIGLLFSLKSSSQSIDISKNWLITIGDTLDWANNSYNDNYWKTMETIGPFEDRGFGNFQNFGWVRKKVIIPSSLKDQAEKSGYFYLSLGRINDADQTFFNGKLVGQTGSMSPQQIGVDRGKRIYKVDATEILWDKENQIAIRIFSNFHNGGLWDKNFNIIIPTENIFHVTQKNISEFPLPKGQQSFEVSTNVNISFKEQALKERGLALKLNLPEQAAVFYNSKYIGKTSSAGEHSFFVPVSFISWGNPDKITVHLNDHESLEKILFSTPAFNTIQGNGFNFIQVSNFKIKKGSFDSESPVTVSVEVFNTTNIVFEGSLTLTLTTDINKIQQSSSHPLRLNTMESKELDFTLLPNFSGVYQVNYSLRKNDTGQKITGTLIKDEKL
jgi:hypothetical protein